MADNRMRGGVIKRGNTWSYVVRETDPETAGMILTQAANAALLHEGYGDFITAAYGIKKY